MTLVDTKASFAAKMLPESLAYIPTDHVGQTFGERRSLRTARFLRKNLMILGGIQDDEIYQ